MATETVIAAQTTAVTKAKYNASAHVSEVSFTATGLATTETITPYVGGGAAWTPLYDSSGTQIKLTATKPQLVLPGGAHYAFDKDVTNGAASLEASPKNFT